MFLMKYFAHSVLFLLFLFFISTFLSTSVLAGKLEFSPNTGTFQVNTPFDVKVIVDTETVDTMSTDAVISYDNTLLKVNSVTYGSFYGTVLHSEKTNKLTISGMVADATKVVNGTGTLATVSFTPLTNGAVTLSFDCTTGRTDDSNIARNDLNATDIINCGSLQEASYTIGAGGTVTPSVTPAGGGNDNTNLNENIGGVADEIPETGSLDWLTLMPKILMGFGFLLVGLIPFLII